MSAASIRLSSPVSTRQELTCAANERARGSFRIWRDVGSSLPPQHSHEQHAGKVRHRPCEQSTGGWTETWPGRSPMPLTLSAQQSRARGVAEARLSTGHGSQPPLHTACSSWSITSKQSCHAQHRTRRWHGRARQLLPVSCTAVNRQFVTHEEAGVPLPMEDQLEERLAAVPQTLNAFYRFSRPHTMLGTFVSVVSVSALAVGPTGWSLPAVAAVLQALVPALFMNICIVGLNQIYDVPIDKINKPYLPLASGEFSMQTGVALVVASGVVALGLGVLAGSPPLMATLVGSLVLGIAYSTDVPFLRWKQNPVAAAGCILAVRAVMVQLGFFFHIKLAMGASSLTLTRPLLFAMAFMLIFSVTIALFKDIPDVKGDAQEGVRTFSVRMGVKNVFWTCIALVEVAYAGAIGVGLMSEVLWSKVATVGVHALLGLLLLGRARQTDLSKSSAIYSCYMFLWKLFYAEYLLLPLFC